MTKTGIGAAVGLLFLVLFGTPLTALADPLVYYGAHPGIVTTSLADFESRAGKAVAIQHKFQSWGSSWRDFPTTQMSEIRAHGSIPLLTWEPWTAGGGANQSNYTLRRIYEGYHDSYIIQWAIAARNWGHPLFLRFAHEMNGTWYPWCESVNTNASGEYIKAWQRVVNLFRNNGATNVTFVWVPNVNYWGSPPLSRFYPGDSYVHWVGFDGYNRGNSSWKTFTDVVKPTYDNLRSLAPGKPIMLAETSSWEWTAGAKAAWIKDALEVQMPNQFPFIKAIVWFNQLKETADWRINSSTNSQAAFAAGISKAYYAGNSFGAITQSPIPPLGGMPSTGSTTSKTFTAVADATVRAAYPSSNFGVQTVLWSDAEPLQDILLKFSVTNLSGTVTKAKIRMYVSNGTTGGPSVRQVSSAWSESTVTWSTRPGDVTGNLSTSAAVGPGSWVEFDVTSVVKVNGTFSFRTLSSSYDGLGVTSREGGQAPQLVITNTP